MAEKKSGLLSLTLIVLNLAVISVVYYFPLTFPLALVELVPVTAYLGKRTKLYGLIAAIVACGTVAGLINKTYVYMWLPVYAFGVIGVMGAVSKRTYVGFAWCAAGFTIGLLSLVAVVFAATRLNVMDAAGKFIAESEHPAVYRMAGDYEVRRLVREEGEGLSGKRYRALKREIKQRVAGMDREVLKQQFAQAVRYHLYGNFMRYFGTAIPLAAGFSYWLGLILIRLYQSNFKKGAPTAFIRNNVYDISPLSEWQLPQGYFWGVVPGSAVLGLLAATLESDLLYAVFSAVFPMLVVVPFGIAGISIIAYFFTRKGKRRLLALTVILLLLIFLLPFLPVIGALDYFLKARKLIKVYDETDTL